MKVDDFAPLTPAEQRLLEGLATTDRTTFGAGDLPGCGDAQTTLRASLLRAVLLGQLGAALDPKGLRLRGARITGLLDLQGISCAHDISLSHCVLEEPLSLVNARMRGLYVSGCHLVGISADNAVFDGSVFIRAETLIDGDISLAGARVQGDVQIVDAKIETKTQDAIFAPSLQVAGSLFLGNYPYADGVTSLIANGTVFLSSAQISHDLFVTHTGISLRDDVPGDTIFGATEEHGRDMALSLARARIGGILYLQNNQISRGIVNLGGAVTARLTDEPMGPGAFYPIRLDGFRYTDFSRHADTSLKARLAWLERRPQDTPFTAQPYEQLAKTFIDLGHRSDAQSVLLVKERLLRAEGRKLMHQASGASLRWMTSLFTDRLLRWTIGYGYRPGRAVVLALCLILGLGVFYDQVWKAGDMTPNAAPILVSSDWVQMTLEYPENPAAIWSSPNMPGQDWETFNAFAYAADLVVPLVALGQESAWAPSTSRSPWGQVGWWLRWVAKTIGWVVTALAAAAVTGVVRRD